MSTSPIYHNPTLDLFDNSKLNLDMSFNRNPEGRFACDISPLSQDPFETTGPTPTFEEFEPTEQQLYNALLEWKFPVRTDYARGLIWGPFKHCRGNSWSSEVDTCPQLDPSLFIEPSNQQQYSFDRILDIPVPQRYYETTEQLSDHSSRVDTQPTPQYLPEIREQQPQQQQEEQTQQQAPTVRLQRIFPILRSPIVIRIKPLPVSSSTTAASNSHNKASKRRRQSSRTDSCKSHIASPRILHFGVQPPHQQKKQKFVQVAFSVDCLTPSRIKLCPTSRLKYAN